MRTDHGHAALEAIHAGLFQVVLARAGDLAGELQSLLPPEIGGKLDFDTLQPVAGSFLDAGNALRAVDSLHRLRFAGREALLYVVFTLTDTPPACLPLLLFSCLTRIWERRLCEQPDAPLPLVLPLVVYQGERRWRGPRSFCELLDVDLPSWVAIAPLIPDFEFLLDDLAGAGAAALRARTRLSPFARLSLFLLQRARRSPDLVPELAGWSEVLSALLRAPAGADELALLLQYMLFVSDVSPRRLGQLLRARVGAPAEQIMVTTAEKLIAQGRAEGEREGRARGEAEGRAATLLTLLAVRFGVLEPEHRQRIRSAPSEQLARWTERLLEVEAPAQLFE
jgi:hypothetical protein